MWVAFTKKARTGSRVGRIETEVDNGKQKVESPSNVVHQSILGFK